jgi:DNA-binding GntR family transcriptional regulator
MPPGVPKYRQLVNLVRQRILDGTYLIEEQLPTEDDWVRESGYSRETVRHAFEIMKDAGWVTITHGLGTFVNEPEMRTDDLTDQGKSRQQRPPPHIHRPH